MTTTQIEARDDFCRRVLELPDEDFSRIKQYFDDMLPHIISSHIPNAETIAAMEELRAGRGYKANSVEELMAALHDDDENDD